MSSEEMTYRDRLFAAFERDTYDRVPCPGVTQTGTVDLMEASGAYWPDAHRDAEKMAKLAWAAYEHAGLEGIRVPFIIYTEALAVGVELHKWAKDNMPMVKKYPFSSIEEAAEKLEVPDPEKAESMRVVLDAIRILRPKCDAEKLPLTGHAVGAFLLAFGVVDFMKAMIAFKKDPESFKGVWEKTRELAITWSEAMIDAGVDIVFYNCAALGNFRPDDYEKYGFSVDRECIRKIKEKGAYVLVHVCSDIRPVLDQVVKLGADAISVSEVVKMSEIRERVGDDVTLMGNVNQVFTLIKRGPEEVMAEAKACIEAGTDILAPGCGFGPKTPLANMRAMVEAAKKYGHLARLASGGSA